MGELLCYCGRPYDKRNNRHADDGDPWWCYPEEKGLDDDSRCNAMWDGEEDSDE